MTLLFRFLTDKGVGNIVESHPSLIEPPSNTNWVEKQEAWEKFIAKREWEYFLNKYTKLSGLTKASGRLWGGSWSCVRVE